MPAGQACALPLADTAPPGVTATDVAPVVLQPRVEQEPAAMPAGLAVKLTITGFIAGGVGGGAGGVGGVGVAGVTVTGGGAGAET